MVPHQQPFIQVCSPHLKSRDKKGKLTRTYSVISASDCCQVPEFDNLVALGPKIVPLVVYKLASTSENFIGVNLCMSMPA